MLGSSPARCLYGVRDLTPDVPILNEISRPSLYALLPVSPVLQDITLGGRHPVTLQSTHGDFSYTISTILYSQNTHIYERVVPIKSALNTAHRTA